LSYIYSNKLDKKHESVEVLNTCLKQVTEERDKAKLQARLNKMIEIKSDNIEHVDNKFLFDEGMNDMEDENNFFEILDGVLEKK